MLFTGQSRRKALLDLCKSWKEKKQPPEVFCKKVTGGACNFIKKETLAQVFSCGFCEISKNTFSQNTSRWLLLKETDIDGYAIFVNVRKFKNNSTKAAAIGAPANHWICLKMSSRNEK